MIIHSVTDPESFILGRLAALSASSEVQCCFAVEYSYCQYYLPSQPLITLIAWVALEQNEKGCTIRATVASSTARLRTLLGELPEEPEYLAELAGDCELPWLELSAPLVLEPIYVPKPWGREIWYTGIEVRGQSRVKAQDRSLPLPWLLSLMPNYLAADPAPKIVLLKVLDPLPDEVYGDLYFEMHEQKQEVYVVTHVDPQAWPEGIGGIRLGFDQHKRAELNDDSIFKAAYLAAVKDYETVRRDIDQRLDQYRLAENIGLTDPVDASTLSAWLEHLPKELRERESAKREAMNAFTAIQALRVGDVVKVPCLTPHALQHGVRTVEFQTPVYERKILSFAQKVLTQEHWDTAAALDKVSMEPLTLSALEELYVAAGVVVERVVSFEDFEVQRVRLDPGRGYLLPNHHSYRLLMVISGSVVCYATEEPASEQAQYSYHYSANQALLLPASLGGSFWSAEQQGALLLIAVPVARGNKLESV